MASPSDWVARLNELIDSAADDGYTLSFETPGEDSAAKITLLLEWTEGRYMSAEVRSVSY